MPHYPALAEGGSVEATGLATVHAGEDVVPVGFWAQIGRDISDFLERPIEHAGEQLRALTPPIAGQIPEAAPLVGLMPTPAPAAAPLAEPVAAPQSPATEAAAALQIGGAVAGAAHTANDDLVAALDNTIQALKDTTSALRRDSTKPPLVNQSLSTAPAAPAGDTSSGNSFLSGLLGLGAIGGLVAA